MAKIQVHITACWKEYAATMKTILIEEQNAYTEFENCTRNPSEKPGQYEACLTKLNSQTLKFSTAKTVALTTLAECSARSGE
jgi:hypothetical protein